MKQVAASIATLGPLGRLPPRLASLAADLVSLPVAIALQAVGMIPHFIAIAVLVFVSPAAVRAHREVGAGMRCTTAVLPRVAGLCLALGWGSTPLWLAGLAFATWVLAGQLGFPPRAWFVTWLPPDASDVASDVAAGTVLLVACSLIALV